MRIDRPYLDSTAVSLSRLRQGGEQLAETIHATCPGHAACSMKSGVTRFIFRELIEGDRELRDAMQDGHKFAAEALGIDIESTGWAVNR